MKNYRYLLLGGIILLILASPLASANPDATGVSVLNVSPEITFIHFASVNGTTMINITVSDYNSWKDIYKITVEIWDEDGPVSVVTYSQYSSTDSWNPTDDFNETLGNYLMPSDSRVIRSDSNETVEDLCELTITFTFRYLSAHKLMVNIEDRGGMSAGARVDYPPMFAVMVDTEPIPTDLVSIMVAVVGTLGGIKIKYGSFEKPIKDLRNGVKKR